MDDERKPIVIRRLSSRDLEFQIATNEDKRWAIINDGWTKVIAGSAQSLRRTYSTRTKVRVGTRFYIKTPSFHSDTTFGLLPKKNLFYYDFRINQYLDML